MTRICDDLREINFELEGLQSLQLWVGMEDGRFVAQLGSRYCCNSYAPIEATGTGLAHVLWQVADALRQRQELTACLEEVSGE